MANDNASNGPGPVPGNVTDDTWTRLITAAAEAPNGRNLIRSMVRNAENAKSN